MLFRRSKKRATYYVSTSSKLLESAKLKENLNAALSEISQNFDIVIPVVQEHINTTYIEATRVQYVTCYCRITLELTIEDSVRDLLQKKYPSVRFDREPPQFVY